MRVEPESTGRVLDCALRSWVARGVRLGLLEGIFGGFARGCGVRVRRGIVISR